VCHVFRVAVPMETKCKTNLIYLLEDQKMLIIAGKFPVNNIVSVGTFPVQSVSVAAETCLPSRCLAMDVSSGSPIPAFRDYATILSHWKRKQIYPWRRMAASDFRNTNSQMGTTLTNQNYINKEIIKSRWNQEILTAIRIGILCLPVCRWKN
jgi:hypothetical protein